MQMGVDLKSSYIFSQFSPRQACRDNAYLHSCLQSCFWATGTANNVCVQTVSLRNISNHSEIINQIVHEVSIVLPPVLTTTFHILEKKNVYQYKNESQTN